MNHLATFCPTILYDSLLPHQTDHVLCLGAIGYTLQAAMDWSTDVNLWPTELEGLAISVFFAGHFGEDIALIDPRAHYLSYCL